MDVDNKVIQPPAIIFTDLDGTLLDHSSYQWDRAKPALDLCQRFHVPVVLVSSKTRAEMVKLKDELGLSHPFISENGGGIFFPKEFHKLSHIVLDYFMIWKQVFQFFSLVLLNDIGYIKTISIVIEVHYL